MYLHQSWPREACRPAPAESGGHRRGWPASGEDPASRASPVRAAGPMLPAHRRPWAGQWAAVQLWATEPRPMRRSRLSRWRGSRWAIEIYYMAYVRYYTSVRSLRWGRYRRETFPKDHSNSDRLFIVDSSDALNVFMEAGQLRRLGKKRAFYRKKIESATGPLDLPSLTREAFRPHRSCRRKLELFARDRAVQARPFRVGPCLPSDKSNIISEFGAPIFVDEQTTTRTRRGHSPEKCRLLPLSPGADGRLTPFSRLGPRRFRLPRISTRNVDPSASDVEASGIVPGFISALLSRGRVVEANAPVFPPARRPSLHGPTP